MGRSTDFYREWLLERIRQAEARVVEAQQLIDRHREMMTEDGWRGEDVDLRRKILNTLEELQAMRIADRDRLQKELGGLPPPE